MATFVLTIDDDFFASAEEDDRIDALSGNDYAHGGPGNDTIQGGLGNDSLDGGWGDDALYGGEGDDWLGTPYADLQDFGTDDVYGGAGDDWIFLSSEHYGQIDGGDGRDHLVLFAQTSLIGLQLAGIEELVVATGQVTATIAQLAGFQSIVRGAQFNIILQGPGGTLDLSQALTANDWAFVDTTALTSVAYIGTGAGNDTLLGTTHADTLAGGAGDDVYRLSATHTVVIEAVDGGHDVVETKYSATLGDNVEDLTITDSGNANGTGNTLDNLIIGNDAHNRLAGMDGNDTLIANGGADTLGGGNGDDSLAGGSSNDTLWGSAGNDTLDDGSGSDLADGGIGNDLFKVNIETTGDHDTLRGGAGDDTFSLSIFGSDASGSVSIDGGAGYDRLVIDGSARLNTATISTTSVEETYLPGGVLYSSIETLKELPTLTTPSNFVRIYLTGAGGSIDLSHATAPGTSLSVSGEGLSSAVSIITGAGNDYLSGTGSADTFAGGAGNDSYGVRGNDVIVEAADGGIDTVSTDRTYSLAANLENLTLTGYDNLNGWGNSADNAINGNDGSNRLGGGDGNDTLQGGEGSDTLYGGDGNDALADYGWWDPSGPANVFFGGAGNDTLGVSGSPDSLYGGSGDDTFVFSDYYEPAYGFEGPVSPVIRGGDGWDTIQLGSAYSFAMVDFNGIEELSLSPYATVGMTETQLRSIQSLTTESQSGMALSIVTGPGSFDFGRVLTPGLAVYVAGFGAVRFVGGSGDDAFFGSTDNDTLIGAAGNDQISGAQGNDILRGGDGNDLLDESYAIYDGDDVMSGGAGNDTIKAGTGDDTAWGGAGDDTIDGGDGANMLGGGDGNDTIQGGDLADTLYGGNGDDVLHGDTGQLGSGAADSLAGGSGNDTLNGGYEGDTLAGGDGDDLFLDNPSDYGSDVRSGGTGNDTFELINSIGTNTGGYGNDVFKLTGYAYGLPGSSLDGGAGADVLRIDSSSYLDLSQTQISGIETLDMEYLSFGTFTTAQLASFQSITAHVATPESSYSPPGVINLVLAGIGSVDLGARLAPGLAVVVDATHASGVDVRGGDSDDYLWSGAADDTFSGGGGNDTLFGGAGDDRLDGGADADRLLGGAGQDTLTGGAGSDVFVLSATPGAADADRITDFDTTSDHIELPASIFTGLSTGPLAAGALLTTWPSGSSWISSPGPTAATRLIYDRVTGDLSYDADGAGGQPGAVIAHLSPGLKLSAEDFMVV